MTEDDAPKADWANLYSTFVSSVLRSTLRQLTFARNRGSWTSRAFRQISVPMPKLRLVDFTAEHCRRRSLSYVPQRHMCGLWASEAEAERIAKEIEQNSGGGNPAPDSGLRTRLQLFLLLRHNARRWLGSPRCRPGHEPLCLPQNALLKGQ